MSVPSGKSTEGLCWTPRRELCSGSQVSSCVPVVPFSRTPTKYDLREASYGESFRLPIIPHQHIVTEFAWYPVSCCVWILGSRCDGILVRTDSGYDAENVNAMLQECSVVFPKGPCFAWGNDLWEAGVMK